MENLSHELREARRNAASHGWAKAKHHIDEALELLDDAMARRAGPKVSSRAVRGYLAEAGFAITKADSVRAVSAIDEALKSIDQGT